MKPNLWGPTAWELMFHCAYHSSPAQHEVLTRLLQVQLPLLIPCERCRTNYTKHKVAARRRAGGPPNGATSAIRWLYFLKDEVDGRRSVITLVELEERLRLHGGRIDDVKLSDFLVLVAIEAHDHKNDDVFLEMCRSLSELIMLPEDSQLTAWLCAAERPIVTFAHRMSCAARAEHGLQPLSMPHFRTAFLL